MDFCLIFFCLGYNGFGSFQIKNLLGLCFEYKEITISMRIPIRKCEVRGFLVRLIFGSPWSSRLTFSSCVGSSPILITFSGYQSWSFIWDAMKPVLVHRRSLHKIIAKDWCVFLYRSLFFVRIFHVNSSRFLQNIIIGWLSVCFNTPLVWLVPAQDVHFFYMRSHLSALRNCALLFSTNFQFIFIFKNS